MIKQIHNGADIISDVPVDLNDKLVIYKLGAVMTYVLRYDCVPGRFEIENNKIRVFPIEEHKQIFIDKSGVEYYEGDWPNNE